MAAKSAEKKLAQIRLYIAERLPYYAVGLFAMHWVPTPEIPMLAADKYWRVYFNPSFVANTKMQEVAGLLYVELEHLLREHAQRQGSRDWELWCLATLLEILDDVEAWKFPYKVLHPTRDFGLRLGQTAEVYYERLRHDAEFKERAEGHAKKVAAEMGSASGGPQRRWELGEATKQSGLDNVQRRGLLTRIEQEVQDAIRRGLLPGNIPGYQLRRAREAEKARGNWINTLRGTVTRGFGISPGEQVASYRRISRRPAPSEDFLLPGIISLNPVVKINIDTSGSVNGNQLGQGLAETRAIIRALGYTQTIIVQSVDTQVNTVQRVFRPEEISLVGNGGTDMIKGIEFAVSTPPRPDLLIIFTDGHTEWPLAAPPGVRVIVVLIGTGEAPAWAEVVRIPVSSDELR